MFCQRCLLRCLKRQPCKACHQRTTSPNRLQVLGIAHEASDEDSADDEAYRNLYAGHATARSTAEDAGASTSAATSAAGAGAGAGAETGAGPSGKPPIPLGAAAGYGLGAAGSPLAVRTMQRQGSSMSSSSPTAASAAVATGSPMAGSRVGPPSTASSLSASLPASALTTTFIDPLDPCDPIAPWRAAVEDSLQQLAASTATFATASGPAQRDALSDLLRHMTALGAHVEYMRKQPHSSRWGGGAWVQGTSVDRCEMLVEVVGQGVAAQKNLAESTVTWVSKL